MKNIESWKPSKFIYKNGKLKASSNTEEVGVGSRLMTNIIAEFYDGHIKKYFKGKLLDLGCGKVPLYEAYKDYVSENICADWENSLHKNEYLDTVINLNLNQKLIYSENEFNTILLSDVLEHLRYPETILKETYRILKEGGIIVINVPFYYGLHEEPYDYFRYTRYALESMIKNSGFEIIELNPLGGTPEILADIFSKHIRAIPLVGNLVSSLVQTITWWFIRTKIGRRISKLTSNKYPIAYYAIAQKHFPSLNNKGGIEK